MQKCNTLRWSNSKAFNAGRWKFCVNHYFKIKQNFLLFCKTECDSSLSECVCLYHTMNNIPQFSLNKRNISLQRGHIINSSSLYISAHRAKINMLIFCKQARLYSSLTSNSTNKCTNIHNQINGTHINSHVNVL